MTARKRVICPVCQRNVALTPTGKIGWHKDPTGRSRLINTCDAAGKLTEADAVRADLERLAELVFAYPARARELVAQLPEEAG